MSHYSNQVSINIAEVVTLTFNHLLNEKATEVATVVVSFEQLKGMRDFFTDSINKHDKMLVMQKEDNKKLS